MNLFMVFHNSGYPREETASLHMGSSYQGAVDVVPESFRTNIVSHDNFPDPQEPYTSSVESSMVRELVEFYTDGTEWYSIVAFETI